MNVFIQEFKAKRKSVFIWGLSISAFIIFYLAFFPSLGSDSEAFEIIMKSMPKEMLQAFGLKEGLSMATLMGYFVVTFVMIQLAIAIQSANYGFAILSEEERELTADFLLTKPVSRSTIYFSKFLSAVLSLLLTAIIVSMGILVALRLFNGGETYNIKNVFKLLLTIPLFQLCFLSIGMFISLLVRKVRNVLSLSMGLAIGLYIINVAKEIVDKDFLGYLTPFNYFEPGNILKTGTYDLKLFFVAIGVIIISLIASFYLYNTRDIHSV